jgi:hypothetical protein
MIFIEGKVRSIYLQDKRPNDIFPDHPSVLSRRCMFALCSDNLLSLIILLFHGLGLLMAEQFESTFKPPFYNLIIPWSVMKTQFRIHLTVLLGNGK